MNEEIAFKIISKVEQLDVALNELFEISFELDTKEKSELRKCLADTIANIHEKIEIPIYSDFPNLPNRRDK